MSGPRRLAGRSLGPSLGLLGLVGLLLAGCGGGSVSSTIGGLPACTPKPGTISGGSVIMAQSVPSAQWLPCIRALPAGWSFADLDPRNGAATFYLDSDRDGRHALAVLLRPSCDIDGATEVPTDQPGLRRYEAVNRVSQGYAGDRYYVFTGGCITYRFNLSGGTRAEPVAAVSEALGFVRRTRLVRQVSEVSEGRLELDPAGGNR